MVSLNTAATLISLGLGIILFVKSGGLQFTQGAIQQAKTFASTFSNKQSSQENIGNKRSKLLDDKGGETV